MALVVKHAELELRPGLALLGRAPLSWWVSTIWILAGLGAVAALSLEAVRYAGLVVPLTSPALGFGLAFFGLSRLTAVRHAAAMTETPLRWARPTVPLGTHAPAWPQ